MSAERLQQRISDFHAALSSLEEGLSFARDDLHRDGVIQRFEFTYELAWKVMKLWLAAKDVFVGNPKDALQESLQNGLIADGNLWSSLHRCRNMTSHTYDAVTASQVFDAIRTDAIPAFRDLLSRLKEERKP